MNNLIPVPRYTYDDYANWKEDWELIGGNPYQLFPSAKWQHNNVQGNLFLQAKVEINRIGCNCFTFTEHDWKINNETVVRPVVMIVCGEIKTDYLEFPPVLIAEVISKESIQKDSNVKFDLYRENGVKYYLMADHIKKTVEVFELIDNLYKSVERSDFIVTNNCSISFDFTTIFKTSSLTLLHKWRRVRDEVLPFKRAIKIRRLRFKLGATSVHHFIHARYA